MAIQNKTVTMLGATAKVSAFTIYPQADGSYIATITGTVTDGASFTDQLSATKSYGSGVAILNNMAAAALQELRIQNGLEV